MRQALPPHSVGAREDSNETRGVKKRRKAGGGAVWWGEATAESAREDARSTQGGDYTSTERMLQASFGDSVERPVRSTAPPHRFNGIHANSHQAAAECKHRIKLDFCYGWGWC